MIKSYEKRDGLEFINGIPAVDKIYNGSTGEEYEIEVFGGNILIPTVIGQEIDYFKIDIKGLKAVLGIHD